MGSCISKEFHSAPQHPCTELQQPCPEGTPIMKEQTVFCWDPLQQCFKPSSNGTERKVAPGYDVTELATSSLLGLVATFKDHITKPTAMAQGRVAHLIEWKGWGSSGQRDWGVGAGQHTWVGAPGQRDWGGLQEQEQYSDLSDELKEARFAAGVAEQFALAEASLSAWSSMEALEEPDGSSILLPDSDGPYLSQFPPNGAPWLYSEVDTAGPLSPLPSSAPPLPHPGEETEGGVSPSSLGPSLYTGPGEEVEAEKKTGCPLVVRRTSCGDGALRHADSSSLSEDEVFYN
ncbi:protein FAM131C [Amia ocellicauda]|uniref:protein FAM131C n=1 Tax=Amia ocellicauda TaxID=2972642 RepID=UPI0034643B29